MMPKRLYYRFERWNQRWGAALALFMLATIMVSIGTTAILYLSRGNEQAARLRAQDDLLTCLDRYTKAQYTGATAARTARAKYDQAQTNWDAKNEADNAAAAAITSLFIRAVSGRDVSAQAGPILAAKHRTEVALHRAYEHKRRAKEQLDATLATNPVPLPPSQFCRASDPATVTQQDVTPKAYPKLQQLVPTHSAPPPSARPPGSAAPSNPAPSPSSPPRPTRTVRVTATPTPTPSPSASPTGLVELIDNTLQQIGLPPLP